MELQDIKLVLRILSILIALFGFGTLTSLAVTYQPGRMLRIYERIHQKLREKKRWFDYEKTDLFLRKTGASYHFGTWIEPIKYQAIRFLIAVCGLFLGSQYHLIVSFCLFLLGYQLPKIYLLYANLQDNEKLLPEMKMLYNALAIQIKSGLYVTDALAECYNNIWNKRLRQALLDLSGSIVLKADIYEALNELQSKFDNRQIDSLCVILAQAMESGQAVELLSDISGQIKDMEVAVLAKKKSKLDRDTTFYLLGIMATMLGLVLYACITQMFTTASTF